MKVDGPFAELSPKKDPNNYIFGASHYHAMALSLYV